MGAQAYLNLHIVRETTPPPPSPMMTIAPTLRCVIFHFFCFARPRIIMTIIRRASIVSVNRHRLMLDAEGKLTRKVAHIRTCRPPPLSPTIKHKHCTFYHSIAAFARILCRLRQYRQKVNLFNWSQDDGVDLWVRVDSEDDVFVDEVVDNYSSQESQWIWLDETLCGFRCQRLSCWCACLTVAEQERQKQWRGCAWVVWEWV